MSISSDVCINRKEAIKRVKIMLMNKQEMLVDKAIASMDDWELSGYLNIDSDLYYYHIESDNEETDNE